MPTLQCQCDALCAELEPAGLSIRLLCYCTDCRAFARFLKRAKVLDARGSAEIVQVAQSRLWGWRGAAHLAALKKDDAHENQ